MNPQLEFPESVWPQWLYNDWSPTVKDKDVVRARIKQRINEKPGWYKYYGETVT